jgi:hypothetical protein
MLNLLRLLALSLVLFSSAAFANTTNFAWEGVCYHDYTSYYNAIENSFPRVVGNGSSASIISITSLSSTDSNHLLVGLWDASLAAGSSVTVPLLFTACTGDVSSYLSSEHDILIAGFAALFLGLGVLIGVKVYS